MRSIVPTALIAMVLALSPATEHVASAARLARCAQGGLEAAIRPSIEAEMTAILDLSLEQRLALLHQEGRTLGTAEVENFLKLACYDGAAWKTFLDEVSVHGYPVKSEITLFLRLLRTLPEPQRTELLKGIGQKLPGTAKGGVESPNRFLKLMAKELLDPPAIMAMHFDDPVKGLQEYFDLLHASLPDHPASGTYSAQDVMAVAKEIQKMIPSIKFHKTTPKPYKFILYGSFPNGLADLQDAKTDYDILTDGAFRPAALTAFTARVQSAVPSQAQVRLHWNTAAIAHLTNAGPFAIEISEAGITLHVYGAPTLDRDLFKSPLLNSYSIPNSALVPAPQ